VVKAYGLLKMFRRPVIPGGAKNSCIALVFSIQESAISRKAEGEKLNADD
jgi:hypothetical protein